MQRVLTTFGWQSRLAVAATGLAAALIAGYFYLSAPVQTEAQTPPSKGAQVFMNNCQVCHGAQGQGSYANPLIPRRPQVTALPREGQIQGLTNLLRNGIDGRMPRFSPDRLSDADIAALNDWLNEADKAIPQGRRYRAAVSKVAATESDRDRTYFAETGHTVSYAFKRYFEANGGIRRFGFPISEEYLGYDDATGTWVTMQMFERARLEYRPGQAGGDVQEGLLGSEIQTLRVYSVTSRGGTP